MKLAYLAGRILLVPVFWKAAFDKATSFAETQQFMESKELPMTGVLLAGAIALEALGGLSLLLGFKARIGALALIAFLIPTTWLFHYEPGNADQMGHLMKNLAILGGLFLVAAHGSGPLSVDARSEK